MSFVLFGTAFSTFIFSDSDHVNEKSDDGEGFIDDINNNYTLDANSYTVYFFASPAWAHYVNDVERKEGQTLDDYLSFDSYLNYFNNTLRSKQIGDYNAAKYNIKDIGTSGAKANDLKKIGYYPDVKTSDNMDIYGYKKRYADTCISSTTFDSLNNPTTTGRDQEQYRLLFIGWTANIKSAMDYGYNSQGNYDYVSAYDELALLDNAENDCQNEADKVIFLYPVFTAGKEYASVANNRTNGETVVRLHGRNTVALTDDDGKVLYAGNTPKIYFENELYFSQNGSRNAACYSYKNLRVEKNQRLYLDFALSKDGGAWGGEWYNFWDSVETASGGIWEGELTKLDSYKNSLSSRAELRPLFDTVGEKGKTKENHWCAWDQPGIYNIYVYPHCEGSSGLSSESDYTKISSYNTLSDEFESIQLSNTSLVWYEDPKDSTKQVSSWYTKLGKYFKVYVKIEQVMELNLGGGRAKSLEQSHGAQLNRSVNIIPSDNKTDSSSSEVVKEGESSRYYVANNVFLEGTEINETLTSFNSTNGKEYHYPSDVSVVLSTGNQAVPVIKATNETLTDFDAKYHKTYGNENLYNFLNTEVNRYKLATKDAMVGDDKEIGGVGLPLFTDSTASDGNTDYFVRTTDSGFYSVFAKIKLTSKRVDGEFTKPDNGKEDHHYCTLSFDSCEIGLAYGKPIYSYIYLYQNGTVIKREGKKVENSGDFIEVEETKGNWYAKAQVLYGNPLTYSTEFRLRNSENTITLGKILGVAATGAASHLTNHLTGREFRFDDSGNTIRLRRSYAFYIMPGAWKEGELKKTV